MGFVKFFDSLRYNKSEPETSEDDTKYTKENIDSVMKILDDIKTEEKTKSYTKRWMDKAMYFSMACIIMSYILAFIGREQIAENLAIAMVTTMIGSFISYLPKSFNETKQIEDNKFRKAELLAKLGSVPDEPIDGEEPLDDDNIINENVRYDENGEIINNEEFDR